jgi:sirohydrochlorin ferrochelatase
MTGYVIFAHGSSIEDANDSVRSIAARFAAEGSYELVEAAFLEGGRPRLPDAVRRIVNRGADRVIIIPYFLTPGLHLQRDLPGIVGGLTGIYKDVAIEIAPSLEGHDGLLGALLDRARDATNGGDRSASKTD